MKNQNPVIIFMYLYMYTFVKVMNLYVYACVGRHNLGCGDTMKLSCGVLSESDQLLFDKKCGKLVSK